MSISSDSSPSSCNSQSQGVSLVLTGALLRRLTAAHLVPDPSACHTQLYRLLITQLVDPFSLRILLAESVHLFWVVLDPMCAVAQETG